jgi:hypothetical protein
VGIHPRSRIVVLIALIPRRAIAASPPRPRLNAAISSLSCSEPAQRYRLLRHTDAQLTEESEERREVRDDGLAQVPIRIGSAKSMLPTLNVR